MAFDTLKWVLLVVCMCLFGIKFYLKRESLLWGILFYGVVYAAVSYYIYFNSWGQGWKLAAMLVASFAFWQFLFKEISQYKRLRVMKSN